MQLILNKFENSELQKGIHFSTHFKYLHDYDLIRSKDVVEVAFKKNVNVGYQQFTNTTRIFAPED
jgi:hypothetical protein